MKKILKKTITILLGISLLFVGLTVISAVAPDSFDLLNQANAESIRSSLHLDNLVETAHAQDSSTGSSSSEAKKIYNNIVSVIVVMIEFLSALLWPILLLIGSLLQNDILFSGGMEQTMLNIWVNVRNLVNILFILVLLAIAFYNVLGGSAEDYQIKSILPKFIVALIAVNFSFLAVRLVADTVNVFTVAIFSLPNTVQTELKTLSGEGTPNKLCQQWSKRTNFLAENPVVESNGGTSGGESNGAKVDIIDFATMCKETTTGSGIFEFTSDGKKFFDTFSANNAALVMAIDMGKIVNIDDVKLKKSSQNPILDLTINILLTVVLYIVYTSGFLALFIILVVRMVLLWVTAVLSPLVVLRYVLPESIKSAIGGGGDLSKKLIQSIIAPIPIALMMTIGFIMFESLKITSFGNSALGADTGGFNLLTSGISTLQDLIIAVGMVVVIWMGVFAAASGTFAESIVDGLKGAVEGAGKFVATAPFKYMPIIPVRQSGGEDGAVSVGTALGALKQIPAEFESKEYEKRRSLASRFMGGGDVEKLDFSDAKTVKEVANRFRISGDPVAPEAQQKLYNHLNSNKALLAQIAPFFGKTPAEFLEELKNGKVDQDRLYRFIEKYNDVKADTASQQVKEFEKFKPNSSAQSSAIRGAFTAEQQQKINSKTTASPEDQEKIGQAILDLNTTWNEGKGTNVDKLDDFVNNNKDDVKRVLQNSGVPADQVESKANEFLVKILEEKKKNASAEDQTKIDAIIARIRGGSTPTTPPAAPPATPNPATPPPAPPATQ